LDLDSRSGGEALRPAQHLRDASLSRAAPWAAIGCCLAFAAAALLRTAEDVRAPVIVADLAGVLLPLAVAAFQLRRDPANRFARLSIGVAMLWAASTLTQSDDSLLYTLGRASYWVYLAALVYLMLSFPEGTLSAARERRLIALVAGVLVVLALPTLLVAQFPTPIPVASCGTDCPANAFALTSHNPAFVDNFIFPLRNLLTVVVYAGAAATLVDRARVGGVVTRRLLAPVAATATAGALSMAVYLGSRSADLSGTAATVVGDITLFLLPAIAISFGVGVLLQRLYVADLLERLARDLTSHVSAQELRRAMAHAMRDPELEIVYRTAGPHGRWIDENGWPVAAPLERRGRAVTEVRSDGYLRAAIVHDADLAAYRDVVAAACSYALTALENERLADELAASLRELSMSRARVIAAADRERRRIARDLHDGAQQRLVALRAKLGLVSERSQEEAPPIAASIKRLEDDVDATIDEMRAFARGIYPALLGQRGLSDALRAAGRSAAVPTIVDAGGLSRYPPEIEATVYFACMEALQNAAKHARGLSGVAVTVSENGGLHFVVSDDGAGFDPDTVRDSAGLTNLRDRLAAVGGTLEIRSAPGAGTQVVGDIPDARATRRRLWQTPAARA
jgi:signal transduction histidine kinase